jgi:hypothetical protein
MDATAIGLLTYEIIREFEDRIRMQHEDERTRLLNAIVFLSKRHEKDVSTSRIMKTKFAELSRKFEMIQKGRLDQNVYASSVISKSEEIPIEICKVQFASESHPPPSSSVKLDQSKQASKTKLFRPDDNPVIIGALKNPHSKKAKFEEPIRRKSDRENLNGHSCDECARYFSALEKMGFDTKDMINTCSRHRTKYTPPSTPDGYWDLSMKENCWEK